MSTKTKKAPQPATKRPDGTVRATRPAPASEVVDLDVTVVRDSRGRRITEDDAARIAEQTLARVGRPSLTGAGQKSPQIAFRVSAATRSRAEQLAADEGRTVSELARHALEEYVKAQPNG
jgi:hypothetical protein